MYGKCVPVVVAATAVLALGVWNPALLQKRVGGQATGVQDPKLVALAALAAGLAACLALHAVKRGDYKF